MAPASRSAARTPEATPYDWAQSLFDMMSVVDGGLPELAAAANLDPRAGDLSDADLRGLDLAGQDLRGWDLRNASLYQTNIADTDLESAVLDPLQVRQARGWSRARLGDDIRLAATRLHILEQPITKLGLPAELTARLSVGPEAHDIGRLATLNADRVFEFVGAGGLEQVQNALQLKGLWLGMKFVWPPSKATRDLGLKPAVKIRKSIGPGYIICLEDGAKTTSLAAYLEEFGMAFGTYCQRWNLPNGYPDLAPTKEMFDLKAELKPMRKIVSYAFKEISFLFQKAKREAVDINEISKINSLFDEASNEIKDVDRWKILSWYDFPEYNVIAEMNQNCKYVTEKLENIRFSLFKFV